MADLIVGKNGTITVNKKKKKKEADLVSNPSAAFGSSNVKVNTKKMMNVAPVSKASSLDELFSQRDKLTSEINKIELTKDKNQWWDKDDSLLENVGNVIYQAILNPNYKSDQYVKDEKYKQKEQLSKQLSVVNTSIEDYQVANKKYEKGVVGGAEKALDTILGNVTTARRGIETSISKILGQTPSEDVESLTYEEKLAQKARQETSGIGGVGLDVLGGISRMLPQLPLNPAGAIAMGFANYGGGAYNQARQDGYGDKEATAYGIAIGGMEMALTHALGSFSNIYGKSAAGKASQSIIDKTIPKIISNKQVREVLAQFGSEGIEEFLQEYIDGIAKDTLLDGEGLLKSTWKNITDPDKFSDALYSAFVGGITGSTMAAPRAIDAYRYEKATGRNYETGLTKNEQSVLDNVSKERTENIQKEKALKTEIDKQIKEFESTFGTMSEVEKTSVRNRVQEQLEAGEIDFTTSKLSKKEIAKIEQEVREDLVKGNLDIDTIENTLLGEKKAQIRELEQELANTKGDTEKAQIQAKINELQSAKATELQGLLSKDYYLQNSYREANLKKEQFTYETTETDSEYKKSLANDFSKVANNTTKTHELFETLSKIAEDKQTSYGVINNEQLKQLGYDVEGKDVNGLVRVNQDGTQKVLINIDSEKAINRIVGHETTHLLEGTKEYTELQQMVKEYATTKGDYDTKLKEFTKLYEGTNADIENEVTSDLVGDYLFTDSDFINNLSTQKPTIFQKIYNEIKHLYKLATAGSKEARQLERVKKAFDKAYKQNVQGTETDTKYSLFGKKKSAEIDLTVSEAFAKEIINKTKNNIADIKNAEMVAVNDLLPLLTDGGYRTQEQVNNLIDSIRTEGIKQPIEIAVDKNGNVEIANGNHRLDIANKLGLKEVPVVVDGDISFNDIKSNINNEDIRYSLSEDTQGRKLSDNQKEYFKNSEIVDENGNLKVLYHGTPFGKFTTFKGDIFFFSEDYRFAEDYANSKSFEQGLDGDINVVEAYLNAENVFDVTDPKDIQKLREALSDEINFWGRTWDKETLLKKLQRKDTLPPKWKSEQIEGKKFGDYIGDDRNGYNTDMFVGVNDNNEIVYISQERDLQKLSQAEKDMFQEQLMSGKEVSYETYQTVYGDLTKQGIQEKINELKKQGEEYKKDNGFENEAIDYYIKELEQTLKWLEKDLVSETKHKLIPKTATQESTELTDIDNWTYFETAFDANTRKDIVDIIRDLGYDAVNIYEEGKSNYIVFNPNQIKNVTNENPTDNPDINMSLGNQEQAPVRGDIFGSDIKLQIEEAIVPIQETVAELTEQVETLQQEIAPIDPEFESTIDYSSVTEADLPMLEQQWSEDFRNIDESTMPSEVEDTTPEYQYENDNKGTGYVEKNPFDKRDYGEVGKRSVKAYQYENPEVRPFFQEEAYAMRGELESTIKGERFIIGDASQMGNGDYEYSGTKRLTTDSIAELLDGVDGQYKLSYDDIRKGLNAIIEDNGKENIAAAKRIEFIINDRLTNGYTTLEGYRIAPNQEYLDTLKEIDMYNYYNNIPIDDSMIPAEAVEERYTPIRDVSNSENIAPSREIGVNKDGQGRLDLGLNRLNAPEGQPLNRDVEPIDLENAKQLTLDGKEEDLITKTKKELRRALLGTEARKEFILGALDNAKNRSMALMNNTDTIRNTELVFGRDAGEFINEIVFQPEIDNEARSIAWQNQQRQEIKDLGIKARSKESAAVQKYGEKQWVNDAGEVVAYGDAELASEFSDVATQEKIKNAAKEIRKKYDTYIDEANNVLTKLGFEPIKKRNDYMRHFQELNDVFSRYGIPFNAQNMAEHTLPTDINGLTEFWSPQKNYFANMQARKGVKTTYDAITGIDGYIGGIANLIYHTEDIQRGRAFEDLIRETYGEDKGWENLDSLPDELKQARAEKIQDNHLSNYAAWVHEWTNNVAGKKNKLDRSVEAVFGRKAFSILDQTRKQVGANMIGLNLSSSLTNLIAPVQAMAKTNKLAVLKGTADTIKNMFVKDNFMDKNKFLTSRMGTDMISKNAWQKMQDAGFIFMKGMDWFSSNQIVRSKYYELRAKGMSEAEAHSEAGKFAARILGDRTKGANAQLYNSKLVGLVTQFQLEVNNQLYSMFYDTYHESKENAQGNAARTAAGMTFTLGQLFIFTHLFGQTFEALAGYNPTFDLIDMLKTAFGWGEDDEDEEKTLSERLKKAADQLVDALPYVNILTGGGRIPVASGIPNLVGVATGGKDEYGNELTLEDEMKKLLFLLPPTGGNQIKKTTQGLSMFDDDLPVSGSYTDSGNLRFPVEKTPLNILQAGLFGQWANKNAGEYFDKERQPLKSKQIQEYADLDMPIADYWKYRDGLKEQSTIKEKFDYINSLDVTDEQKNIMINNAVDRKEEVDMSNYDDFGSYEEFDFATKYEEKYNFLQENNISYEEYNASEESREAYNWAFNNPESYAVSKAIGDVVTYRQYTKDLNELKADKDEDGKSISGSRKAKVIDYINGLDADYGSKLILFKMEYPSDDDSNQEIINYLNERQDISYEEMATILTKLDMIVDSNGNIRW